jgi:hypothetical protein
MDGLEMARLWAVLCHGQFGTLSALVWRAMDGFRMNTTANRSPALKLCKRQMVIDIREL